MGPLTIVAQWNKPFLYAISKQQLGVDYALEMAVLSTSMKWRATRKQLQHIPHFHIIIARFKFSGVTHGTFAQGTVPGTQYDTSTRYVIPPEKVTTRSARSNVSHVERLRHRHVYRQRRTIYQSTVPGTRYQGSRPTSTCQMSEFSVDVVDPERLCRGWRNFLSSCSLRPTRPTQQATTNKGNDACKNNLIDMHACPWWWQSTTIIWHTCFIRLKWWTNYR